MTGPVSEPLRIGGATLLLGDCVEVMRGMDAASVDAVVTDPPYGLEFMGKEWDRCSNVSASGARKDDAARISDVEAVGGFQDGADGNAFSRSRVCIGKEASALNQRAWHEAWAREALRVLKPGGHLLAFGGTRTYHRMASAIEDAGFEVRDCIMWMYGTGFPKSLDVSKAIDKAAGAEREVGPVDPARAGRLVNQGGEYQTEAGWSAGSRKVTIDPPATDAAKKWQGWGTALKPAYEPVIVARKPLIGTVAENVLAHGTGAINVDACRIGTDGGGTNCNNRDPITGKCLGHANAGRSTSGETFHGPNTSGGRWPANVILDEWHDPVLCLKHGIPEEVERVIRLYYGVLRAVPEEGQDLSEPDEAQALLQPEMLGGMARSAQHREGPSDVRAEAHPGIDPQDAADEGGAETYGILDAELEGRSVPQSGLRDGGDVLAEHSRRASGEKDDLPRAGLRAGAPFGAGAQVGAPTGSVRSGASPERREDRQPTTQSGIVRQRDAQARPRTYSLGTAPTAAGERDFEVRASEVPQGWLTFFEETGRAVRCGSAVALDAQSGALHSQDPATRKRKTAVTNVLHGSPFHDAVGKGAGFGDSSGASRFFYCAKASKRDRGEGNNHPTVKPTALMRYLVRLVTPPGGLVLDPFMGSGSTGVACLAEGLGFIGIERDAQYMEIVKARIVKAGDRVA